MYRGKYKPKGMVVAVKTCRDTLSEDQRKKFLQEGRILKQYDHPNIVKFIGIAAQRQPVMIVMEYVEGKGVVRYLQYMEGKRRGLVLWFYLFLWAVILICEVSCFFKNTQFWWYMYVNFEQCLNQKLFCPILRNFIMILWIQ